VQERRRSSRGGFASSEGKSGSVLIRIWRRVSLLFFIKGTTEKRKQRPSSALRGGRDDRAARRGESRGPTVGEEASTLIGKAWKRREKDKKHYIWAASDQKEARGVLIREVYGGGKKERKR